MANKESPSGRLGASPKGIDFSGFFQQATTKPQPYGYQCRLACGPDADPQKPDTLESGAPCHSQLINIPTGLGKTAGVVLAWLWNRLHRRDGVWPRRLVYCLPMRTLVEQTRDEVKKWIDALHAEKLLHEIKPPVVILMGGEELEKEAKDWDIYPERDTILIGTQDMLLSRVLNRGYGMSRYRWPMHFGLLNNDCLWVMDETQLMGVGVETSAQLDGFRRDGKMQTVGVCPTWWMSATLDETRLATADHPKPTDGWRTETLSDNEKSGGRPKELIAAPKKLSHAPITLNANTKGGYAKQLAALVSARHKSGTLTLVILNRVPRARDVYEALVGGKKPLWDAPDKVALIHSRFRPVDRERHTKVLFGDKNGQGDRIVIATQAVEAGVDVSARLLITELAPWSSLIQRMGRCNRRADIADAEVLWVDIQPKDEKDELLRPYSEAELKKARGAIAPVTDASLRTLREVVVPEEQVIRPVIRRRDLVDLFDTTPDICGQDLDVSRYIRDGDDNDVQFFWRDIAAESLPTRDEKPPQRLELCRVSIGDAGKFFDKKTTRAWRWNPLEKRWEVVEKPRPGAVYLVAAASGGYNDRLGWTGEPKDKPPTHPPTSGDLESYDDEPETFCRSWQELDKHTQLVIEATDALAAVLALDEKSKTTLHTAALWHDVGKAHETFQAMLCKGEAARVGTLWAKSAHKYGKCERRGFRHELASALAWLLAGPHDGYLRDLVAYLIAAHHGKVRLSIRSLPNEPQPTGEDRLFARGVWHGDKLPAIPGILLEPTTLDLSFMQMGESQNGPSWLARTVALRDRLGPFSLAFLETLLRVADARASRTIAT